MMSSAAPRGALFLFFLFFVSIIAVQSYVGFKYITLVCILWYNTIFMNVL